MTVEPASDPVAVSVGSLLFVNEPSAGAVSVGAAGATVSTVKVFVFESVLVLSAASVSVAGKVSGDIVATQRIEIRPSAKVSGNITAPVLSVQEGALFEGHCSMQPEGVREDRKVTVFPKEERVAQVAAGGQKQA